MRTTLEAKIIKIMRTTLEAKNIKNNAHYIRSKK